MHWTSLLFLLPAIIGVTLIGISIILRKYPPRQINDLYGYRTTRSMMSHERWDFAQQFAAKAFLKWGLVLCLFALLGLFVNTGDGIGLAMGMVAGIACIAVPWWQTEKALKERFGKAEVN